MRPVAVQRHSRRFHIPVVNWRLIWKAAIVPFIVVVVVLLRASMSNSRVETEELTFPTESDIDFALLQHVLPEESLGKGGMELHPKVIDRLEVSRHEVKDGETLSELAQKYELTLDTIISFNNIRDARGLAAGSVLQIPNKNGVPYTVKRGDTLDEIASKFGVSLNNILDINDLSSDVIRPGQKFFIPGARMGASELDKVLGEYFIFPTRGAISSRFGMREDPFTRMRRFHNGLDIANMTGTKIWAARSGQVAAVDGNATFGWYVVLKHSGGYQTWYAHLSRILVKTGQWVNQGQMIAEMGNTGYSTGSHLHFSIFKRSDPVDPLSYLQ